ncbi:MAG: hypothetical protein ABIQ16_27270 [Polyangiaceae bacterium]
MRGEEDLAETLLVAISLVLNALLPYLVVRGDLARLSEERLARAWPPRAS